MTTGTPVGPTGTALTSKLQHALDEHKALAQERLLNRSPHSKAKVSFKPATLLFLN